MIKIGYKIAFIVLLLVEAAFIFLMMTLNVLPLKYTAAAIGAMAVVDFAVIMLTLRKKCGKPSKVIGIILEILMICVMCVGTYYMYSTYVALEKITELKEHYELYDVVVSDNSTYEGAADIQGRTVYVYENDSKMYNEAQEKLTTKADVKFEKVSDCNAAISKITTASDTSTDNAKSSDGASSSDALASGGNVIFISDNNYEIFCENDESVKENTKSIYQVKVAKKSNDNADRVNVTEDPFNICITGIDMWGNIDQVSRSDVNMIVTVNPEKRTILLSSMPRDSYVTLHTFQQPDKLTHTGVWGVEETTSTIEDWLGIDINYYVRVDFSMLVDIVNAIDGIDVYSDYTFKSSISKYKYKKGWNHLDGKAALYFARERKSFEDEDQQRIKDQQKVMEACLKKVTGSKTLLTSYTKLLDAVDDEMETDMSEEEMASLVKMQLEDMSEWKFIKQSVQGDLTMKGTYTMGLGRDLLVSIPREESVEKVSQTIHDTMYPED